MISEPKLIRLVPFNAFNDLNNKHACFENMIICLVA